MSREFNIVVSEAVPEGKVFVVSNCKAPTTLLAAALADDGLLAMALLTLGRNTVTLGLAPEDGESLEAIREAATQVGAIVNVGGA